MKAPFALAGWFIGACLNASLAMAGDSLEHAGQASVHSASAVGASVVAGAKLATGSAAVPLMVSGAAGTLSGQAGEQMWKAAGGRIGEPLPVADDTYVATPSPAQALREQE